MCVDASSQAICALKDMDEMACALEKEGSIKTCYSTSDDSDRERTRDCLQMRDQNEEEFSPEKGPLTMANIESDYVEGQSSVKSL